MGAWRGLSSGSERDANCTRTEEASELIGGVFGYQRDTELWNRTVPESTRQPGSSVRKADACSDKYIVRLSNINTINLRHDSQTRVRVNGKHAVPRRNCYFCGELRYGFLLS